MQTGNFRIGFSCSSRGRGNILPYLGAEGLLSYERSEVFRHTSVPGRCYFCCPGCPRSDVCQVASLVSDENGNGHWSPYFAEQELLSCFSCSMRVGEITCPTSAWRSYNSAFPGRQRSSRNNLIKLGGCSRPPYQVPEKSQIPRGNN